MKKGGKKWINLFVCVGMFVCVVPRNSLQVLLERRQGQLGIKGDQEASSIPTVKLPSACILTSQIVIHINFHFHNLQREKKVP